MLHLKIRISCACVNSLSKNAILGYTAKALRIKTLRSIPLAFRAVSSGGERFPDTEEVTSSNLVPPTMFVLYPVFKKGIACLIYQSLRPQKDGSHS